MPRVARAPKVWFVENSPNEPSVPTTPAPPSSGEGSKPSSAAAVKERPAPPRLDRMPPWRVLLHNDAVNDMVYVVETVMELCAFPKTRAIQVMLEAHTRGLALLLTTHKERAELYADQFKSKKLTVSIEPGE